MVILNIGMPRSGTLWRYKLIRDLVMAGGGTDGVDIRKRFRLQIFIGLPNADLNTTKLKRLFPASIPSFLGEKYVLNTHAEPSHYAKWLLRNGLLKAIYGYRDPRDCILSILEYSRRAYPQYSAQFLEIKSVSEAVDYMRTYMLAWEEWSNLEDTLVIRYEDMLENFDDTVDQIVDYLGVTISYESLEKIKQSYLPQQKSPTERTHFIYGKANRFRDNFSAAEQEYLIKTYAPFLEKMGYTP